jgi:hypothetical protein
MLNIFFVPIKLINFDFCPYTKKNHIFLSLKNSSMMKKTSIKFRPYEIGALIKFQEDVKPKYSNSPRGLLSPPHLPRVGV